MKSDILSFTHLFATCIKSDQPALSVYLKEIKNEKIIDLMEENSKLIFYSSFSSEIQLLMIYFCFYSKHVFI